MADLHLILDPEVVRRADFKSGKLVTLVRQEARKLAEANRLDLILTDGPPGIGCPVIASIGGASAALIVTEPTVPGTKV